MSLSSSTNTRTALLASGFLIAMSVLGCAKMGEQPNANYERPKTAEEEAESKKFKGRQELKDKTEEYAKIPAKVQLTDAPYITKKIAYLKTWKGDKGMEQELQNYWASFTTPGESVMNDILATYPDEVGTIVMIEDNKKEKGCKNVSKGTYKDPATGDVYNGYIETCELTIIDPQIPAVIFKKTFEGQLKDKELLKKETGRVLGHVNFDEVYRFLASLPRR